MIKKELCKAESMECLPTNELNFTPSKHRFDDFVVKNRQVLAGRIRSMNVWGGEGKLNCITSVGVIGKCRCLLRREFVIR